MKKEEQNELDFDCHIKHVEDAVNVALPRDSEPTLTDSELEQAGLIKTSAFIRTKKSKNALRIEKHKAKKADLGVKQLNIEIPEEHRDFFKAIAKELTKSGTVEKSKLDYLAKLAITEKKDSNKSINELSKTQLDKRESEQVDLSDKVITYGKKCAEIEARGGFKSFMLKVLIK